jgi:glycosyltransferase involved in cell wall biosynthesis
MTLSVSVVIPNYNSERTLDACVRSALTQTHRPHEVIVVDDASTDRSRDIARRHPCTLIELRRNSGVSVARNAGAAASTGDILFFLDSDQALAPDSIANAVEMLGADPTIGCVHGQVAPVPLIDDGPIERYRVLHQYWWRQRGVGEVRLALFGQTAIRRSVFEAAGRFDERFRDSQDLDYSERLAPITRIFLTDRIVARHDEVDRLVPLLREQFRRSQMLTRTLGKRKGRASLTANRPLGILAVAGSLASLPLVLLSPLLLCLPALGVLVFALADPGMLRFVVRRRGWCFLPFFVGVHLLVNVALVTGVALGAVRAAAAQRVRRRARPAV